MAIRAIAFRASQRCNFARTFTAGIRTPALRPSFRVASNPAVQPPENAEDPSQEDEFEGLLPEEDFEVPGTYFDAMSPNTKLGRAVKEAVAELEILGSLEQEVSEQYNSALQKFGLSLDMFAAPKPPAAKEGEQEDAEDSTEA